MEKITAKSVKARIKKNLRGEKNTQSPLLANRFSVRFMFDEDVFIHSVGHGRSIKEKFIVFGLKHKIFIKKIPLVGWVARKTYPLLLDLFFRRQSVHQ